MVRELFGEVISNVKVGIKNIYLLKIKIGEVVELYPGQFAMIKVTDSFDPFLRRPMSLYNVEKDICSFLYQVVGRGTEILSKKRIGEEVNLLLPLGNTFPKLNKQEKILLVGGGVGIAPLNFLINFYKDKVNFYSYLGFSSIVSEEIYKDFKEYSRELVISTEDGSLGFKGKVLEFLPDDLEYFDKIFSCGPSLMLENLWRRVKDKGKLYFSLEEKMGCGIGICLSCALKGRDRMFHVCKDGPVLSGMEVQFDG